jgi:hypothetical protein
MTSAFVGLVTRWSRDAPEPPPPLKRWSARLVHRAQASDQRFRVWPRCRRSGLSGLFLGTCSTLPYAALCRVAPRTQLVRWGFAAGSSVDEPLHRAALGMPHAVALLNDLMGYPMSEVLCPGCGPRSRREMRPPTLTRYRRTAAGSSTARSRTGKRAHRRTSERLRAGSGRLLRRSARHQP